ncbi:MAG TPA: hypothetical protein VKB42_10775 [Dongiaceae bacterium]|nr:hypothetical protein [Dongiaceae bacterium]
MTMSRTHPLYHYLVTSAALLLLVACSETNGQDSLACAPNYAPGTAAYKSCLLRQGVVGQDGTDGYNTMASPPPAPTLFCIPLGINSTCN